MSDPIHENFLPSPRKFTERIRDHPIIFWLGIIASLASIIGVLGWLHDRPSSMKTSHAKPLLSVEDVRVSQRGAAWDNEYLSKDEVVLRVTGGNGELQCGECAGVSLIGFWRLANAFETNWHISKRRIGGNYELVVTPVKLVAQPRWEALFGGVECDKTYDGDVAFVAMLVSDDLIQKQGRAWLGDNNGWGFKDLPATDAAAVSTIKIAYSKPTR